jgi:peptide/nickel transport system ATP-binding protein
MAHLLELDGLQTEIRLRRSTVHALDGVSFTLDPGECLGIVGESGCGKTMTALSVMRLLPPGGHIVGGKIMLDGKEISALSDADMRHIRGNEIGMIFQDPMTSLNPTMRIGDQISETVLLHRGASAEEARERAIEVLGLVGMPRPAERVGNYPHQLSGGMRQRVMIAMALACEPKLLIADEPTTALDVTIQKQILELIDSLRKRLSMAVILVTHDLGVIAGRADRTVVMYAGKIAESTTTARLFANPRHPYTEALFEALPEKAADSSRRLYNIPGMPPDLTAPPAGCRFAARCRYAQETCRAQEPELKGDSWEHVFRCFFPVGKEERETRLAELAVAEKKAAEAAVAPPEAATGELLRVDHLVKNFAVTSGAVLQRKVGDVSAVADVSFTIVPGQTFGMVGESGCGKTTIGRLIVGLEKATSGAIVLDGEDLTKLSTRERRQRIGVARALALHPKLIVCDEPVSALDVSIQAQILNLMKDLQRDHGLTYMFISHDLGVVRYLSNNIGVMYLGKLVEVGPADEVYYHPVHPYTRGLIDTIPNADPVLEKSKVAKGVAGELPSAIDPPSGCRFRTRCPRAQDLCAAEEPPLRPFGGTHFAACHFPLTEPAPAAQAQEASVPSTP